MAKDRAGQDPERTLAKSAQEGVAAASQPSSTGRDDLHDLIDALPPGQLDAARKFLRFLLVDSEGSGPPEVIPATDAEVDSAGQAFIEQYKQALERLAK